MKPGDVIVSSHIQQIISRDTRLEYSPGKKDNFVFIFLGTEPQDGSNDLDPIERLKELGWNMNDELEKALADE